MMPGNCQFALCSSRLYAPAERRLQDAFSWVGRE
ncbi:MAG: hypothetical protein J07HX5_00895 [halophilic archaeon J07HX5]|nr:MAG: hypothetical protein J07HX5_00895 [halophilic archaeon J07HX5]